MTLKCNSRFYPQVNLHAQDTVKLCESVVVRDAPALKSRAVRNTGKGPVHPLWVLRHLACVPGSPQWCGLCMVCICRCSFHSELTDTGGLNNKQHSLVYPTATTDRDVLSVPAHSRKAYLSQHTSGSLNVLSVCALPADWCEGQVYPGDHSLRWLCRSSARLAGSGCAHTLQLLRGPAEPIFLYLSILWCPVVSSSSFIPAVGLGSPGSTGGKTAR